MFRTLASKVKIEESERPTVARNSTQDTWLVQKVIVPQPPAFTILYMHYRVGAKLQTERWNPRASLMAANTSQKHAMLLFVHASLI